MATQSVIGNRQSAITLHIVLWAGIVGLLVVMFHLLGNTLPGVNTRSVFTWMTIRWTDRLGYGTDYSIGWLIPLVTLWLLWERRTQLLTAPRRVTWWALALILLACALHWAAARAQQPRLSLVAFILLLWSVPVLAWGRAVGRLLTFPLAYLVFCIPWNFLDGLTFPLRHLSSVLSAILLNGLGLPVTRVGTIIRSAYDGGMDFNVADPCSGLSSMLAMAALTVLYGYLTQKTNIRRLILFAMAIPLAIIGNVVRIVTIAVVARLFSKDLAMTVYHDYSAFLIFPVAILLMVAAGKAVRDFSLKGVRR